MHTKKTHLIEICCGTMCYIMGGADIHLLAEHLPAHLKDQVEIKGVSCLGLCDDDKEQVHPCVRINGVLQTKSSISKIIQTITIPQQ